MRVRKIINANFLEEKGEFGGESEIVGAEIERRWRKREIIVERLLEKRKLVLN